MKWDRVMQIDLICKLLTLVLILVFPISGLSQEISPEAISRFQNLPRAQQEALARQYGIDIDSLLAGQEQNSGSSTVGQPGELLQPATNRRPVEQGVFDQSSFDLSQSRFLEEQNPVESEEAARFGMDLFDAEISTFAPVDDALVPDEYKLGPGDTLVIQFFGKENEHYSLNVSRQGDISLPRLGPISLSGLSFKEAEALIQRRVEEQLIGVQAAISMGRLRAISIFMAGEVENPGAYAVSALTTVTQALFVAGGISEIGSLRSIQVKRSGRTVGSFDVHDLLVRGDASGDLRLQSGDVIFVPPYANLVEVEGAVRRPLRYEMKSSETIEDLIKLAGGYSSKAHRQSAVLERGATLLELPELKNIDLASRKDLSLKLRDGDLLRIAESTEQFENQVTLEGAVVRPGDYAWQVGARISDIVRSIDADLLPIVDLTYALIVRIENDRRDIEVLQFDLGAAILNKGSPYDPILHRKDRVIIFGLADEEVLADEQSEEEELSRIQEHTQLVELGFLSQSDALARLEVETLDGLNEPDEEIVYRRQDLLKPILAKLRAQARQGRPMQVVSISGAVKVPGDYPLKQGDRLFDLIRAAGGLTDSAFLDGAEFRRVVGDSGKVRSDFSEVSISKFGVSVSTLENFQLQSRDHLTVREIPDWTPDRTITLRGAVRFPGTYLFGKGERLGDVLIRAGGLTEDGFAAGALFTREEIKEREAEQARQYAEQIVNSYAAATLTREDLQSNYEEIQQISQRLQSYEGVGRMVIDLEAILAGDKAADVSLLDGDELVIPLRSHSIAVIGEVQRAATHSYQSDFDIDDYLELSAGLTKRANEKAIYVVKANGSVHNYRSRSSWFKFSSRDSGLKPGDAIVVPIDNEYRDRFSFWADVTQILSQGSLAVAAILAI